MLKHAESHAKPCGRSVGDLGVLCSTGSGCAGTSEVIPKTDAMALIEDPENEDAIPDDEDVDDDVVRSFQKDNCCVCSLNNQWALPRAVNLLCFELGSSM